MVSIIRGNGHHVKHSCRSDAFDRVAGDIPHIPPSAHTAVNAPRRPTWGISWLQLYPTWTLLPSFSIITT
eukprot:1072402-Pleurochrysis_carterae.AAC.1